VRSCWAIAALLFVSGVDLSTSQREAERGRGLNPKIPAAVEALYKDVLDAQDWLNPEITVTAEGIEVTSSAIAEGPKRVAVDELRSLLISLPVSAWPYGRVVLASDAGLRHADRSDDEPIRRNHQAAERIFESLDIRVEWWP
jgi:hypothetical protein